MPVKRLFQLLLIFCSLTVLGCKTTATAVDATADNNDRRAPRMRTTATSEHDARNIDPARLRPSPEEMRDIPADEVEAERNSGGMTAQEMRSLGISPSSTPEEREAAYRRQEEAKRPLSANPTLEEITNKPFIASMRTTACADEDCPVYEIRILSDYSLYYHGVENVDLPGHYFGKLPTGSPMSQVQRLAIQYRYHNFDAVYPENPTDIEKDRSATITEITILGRRNKVTHYLDGPNGLEDIEAAFFELLEKANWTEVLQQN